MTDEEKELEQKMKQYQYEIEENKKKMETLQNDMHKGKKKSFIFRINRTIGRIIFVWASIGFIVIGGLLIFALRNYIEGLKTFDAIEVIEDKYDMKLTTISREAENKIITYKVKSKKLKYRKIEFTVIREGRANNYDDFDTRYLKYIIEHIKDKSLLEGFQIYEEYDEYGLLQYRLVYKKKENESLENVNKKIQDLQNYILKYDKKVIKIIKNLNKLIINEEQLEKDIATSVFYDYKVA